MRIVILSAPHSAHTIKWVKGLLSLGHHIKLIGFIDNTISDYDDLERLETFFITLNSGNTNSFTARLKWLSSVSAFRTEAQNFRPDIIHAHYATSYGLLGVLSGIKPLVISAWGSDIYEFPKRSFIHKLLLKFILSRANMVLATGNELASETNHYTNSTVEVVPFGVNVNLFEPAEGHKEKNQKSHETIVIGTVKKLEPVYDISTLLRAYAVILSKHTTINFQLQIIGSGSSENLLKEEVKALGIESQVEFRGYVDNELLPDAYSSFDLAVIPSLRESFGISVLEAMSMETPVIASNVSGFKEVGTEETITYFEAGNTDSLVAAIELFLSSRSEFRKKAHLARKRVIDNYSEQKALSLQEAVYMRLIN